MKLIGFLMDYGRSLRSKAVLYPLSDRHVLLFSQYREQLQRYFSYVMPNHETIVRLTTRDGLDSVSQRFSIAAPRTYFISPESDITDVMRSINYPAILKPTESTYWHLHAITGLLRKGFLTGRAKVALCQDSAHDAASTCRIFHIGTRLDFPSKNN